MLDSELIQKDFPIFTNHIDSYGKKLVYLDSASSSQTPRQVVDAMNSYYFDYRSNVHRSSYKIGIKASDAYEESRSVVAKFIGSEQGEIIFTSGATVGMNMLISMLEQFLDFGPKSRILIGASDHHSNLIPLQELVKRKKIQLQTIPLKGTDLDLGAAMTMIDANLKILAVPVSSNVLGTVHDIKNLIKYAKSFGVITIVDATNAIGHMDVNINELGCDFLFFSGHKMFGPTGIGVLFGRKDLLSVLKPGFYGGGIIRSVTEKDSVYEQVPMRFEAGTPNIAGAIGLASAIQYINGIGLDGVLKHAQHLVKYAIKKLSDIPGIRIISERNELKNIGIISFGLDNILPYRLAEYLSESGISVRAGYHCAMPMVKRLEKNGVLRVSFYIYNKESDIDLLLSELLRAKKEIPSDHRFKV